MDDEPLWQDQPKDAEKGISVDGIQQDLPGGRSVWVGRFEHDGMTKWGISLKNQDKELAFTLSDEAINALIELHATQKGDKIHWKVVEWTKEVKK